MLVFSAAQLVVVVSPPPRRHDVAPDGGPRRVLGELWRDGDEKVVAAQRLPGRGRQRRAQPLNVHDRERATAEAVVLQHVQIKVARRRALVAAVGVPGKIGHGLGARPVVGRLQRDARAVARTDVPEPALRGAVRNGQLVAVVYHNGLLPKTPCIPVSAIDAVELIKTLNGIGPSARKIGGRWLGGALHVRGVGYHIGPFPKEITMDPVNNARIVPSKSHSVIGRVPGQTTDEIVLIGTHRDAWGPGAGDPVSGCAALNEVVRSYGEAYQKGWRPLRTIVFASFEGEEYAQIGSLLWIEDHLEWLKTTAVAYLKFVVTGSGPKFSRQGRPSPTQSSLERNLPD